MGQWFTFSVKTFRYNIHDGDQFHVDLKPNPPKPQYSNRTGTTEKSIWRKKNQLIDDILIFQLADNTSRRKRSTDQNPTNSSTSSEDDKRDLPVETSPFSLDSLQKLVEQKDADKRQTFTELDHPYVLIDKNIQIQKNDRDDDDDDDLLLAAAAACHNH